MSRPRLGVLVLLAFAGALTVASSSLGSGPAVPGGCAPIVRTLSNGDPSTTEGALSVTVDGLGAYGWATGPGDAIFNPPGTFAGALGTTHSSNLYLSTAGRMLADDCGFGQVQVLSEDPLTTRVTIGALQLDLIQELDPVTLGHSTLSQTYTLTNTSGADVPVTLVRHLDGDLRFNSSGAQDGAAASGLDGRSLTELDSVSGTAPRAFMRLEGSLLGNQSPQRWTIQPFDYRPVIDGAGGIPPGDSGVVHNDTNGDLIVDIPYDVTLSQQWSATIAPSAAATLVTSTTFDAENRAPQAVADTASTAPGTPVDVNVLANDRDPDGDPVAISGVEQAPAHGTAIVLPNGRIRYAPETGFTGTDRFTYSITDGRGGTSTASVDVTVGVVTLAVVKTGNGSVTSAPAGIDCGTSCSADFLIGTTVRLTATPDPGWTFGGWTGPCSGVGPCVVTMDAAKTVGADFLPPPPVGGESANLQVTRGNVLFKPPGDQDFVELKGATQVPVGSQVNTNSGAVDVTVSRGVALDTSEFSDGTFTILQQNASSLGELRLNGGDFGQCLQSMSLFAKKKPVRRLWGSGKGHFRTKGRYSSATVRGTKWLTEDLCDATRVSVVQGTVVVHDITRNKNIVVPAGHSYTAEALPRGVRNAGCTIIGTSQRDYLEGTPGRDVICGLGGNDVIVGHGGNDRLIGGPGNDWILGGGGDDVLIGNAGNDFLNGGLGHDVLSGGPGNDFMVAHDGGRGNDRVDGGPGSDKCYTDWIRICP